MLRTLTFFIFSILISVTSAVSAPLKFGDNIIYWGYATQSQKTCFVLDFIWLDRDNQQFEIDDNYGVGIYKEVRALSSCIDKRYYDAYTEFFADLEIIDVALACASERQWFIGP